MPAGERIWGCMHDSRPFTLILPVQPTTHAILLLHGAGRNHRTLIDNPETKAALLATKSIVIMPDGGNSWWLDPAPNLALMDWLQAPLAVSTWSATGWSMGAYGSLRLVQQHPQRFAAWAGIIGLLDFPNPQYPKEWNHSIPASFGPRETWQAQNPFTHIAALKGKRVWLATAESAFDRRMNDTFDERLNELQVSHHYEIIPGAHTFPVVATLLPQALDFLTVPPGIITGSITDPANAPVPDATVSLYYPPQKPEPAEITTSKRDGAFHITAAQPGVYRLRIDAIGFRLYETKVTVDPNQTLALPRIQLQIADSAYSIVVDPAMKPVKPHPVRRLLRKLGF